MSKVSSKDNNKFEGTLDDITVEKIISATIFLEVLSLQDV